MYIRLGELEVNLVGGESFVAVRKSFSLVLHHFLIKGVEEDAFVQPTVESGTDTTSTNT